MTSSDNLGQLVAHLEATLTQAKVPAAQLKHGQALAKRLGAPVRVSILGMPMAGKTELLNLLLGTRAIPAISESPTCEVYWSDTPKARVVRSGGVEEVHGWPLPDNFDWTGSVFLKVGLPQAILKQVTFLEVVTNGSPANLTDALNWAIPRTDIAIWCTQEFAPLERAHWGIAPDALKGHSYIVMTKADELGRNGTLPDALRKLTAMVPDEFSQLFAVTTPQYLNAMDENGRPPEKIRNASGGGAIVDALADHVRRGRQANFDAAEVFLARYGQDVQPAVPAAPEKPAKSAPESAGLDAPVQGQLIEIFSEHRARIAALASREDDISEDVLSGCSSAIDDFLDAALSADDINPELSEEIEEAQEQIVLMQLEGDDTSAADAVTVLLQLSRALNPAIAA